MNRSSFETKLNEILSEFSDLPKKQAEKPASFAQKSHRKKLKNNNLCLEESMDYLRLNIKYLLFDLESTHRENDYLRSILEKRK